MSYTSTYLILCKIWIFIYIHPKLEQLKSSEIKFNTLLNLPQLEKE